MGNTQKYSQQNAKKSLRSKEIMSREAYPKKTRSKKFVFSLKAKKNVRDPQICCFEIPHRINENKRFLRLPMSLHGEIR